jgi:histidyl-tRNA synthetase
VARGRIGSLTWFYRFGIEGATIKINNRFYRVLQVIGASDKLIDFTVALDKLDKIGEDGVKRNDRKESQRKQ